MIKPKPTGKCKTCGKEFKKFKTTDKFCSPECVENKPQKKSVKAIKPVSDKHLLELAKYRKVRRKYLEEHPICEVNGCNKVATTIHHRRGRGIYLCDVEYFLAACMPCHEKIELNPDFAYENGYSVKRLSK